MCLLKPLVYWSVRCWLNVWISSAFINKWLSINWQLNRSERCNKIPIYVNWLFWFSLRFFYSQHRHNLCWTWSLCFIRLPFMNNRQSRSHFFKGLESQIIKFLLFVSCLFFNVFIASKFSTWFSLFCLYTMSISLILRIIVNVRCRFFCRSSCNLLLYLIKFIQVNILCKSSHVFFCHILS